MRVSIGQASNFPAGKLTAVKAGDVSLVVTRIDDGFCAVKNQCSHMPLPLAGGKIEGDMITCPWHNSDFNMCTGENIDWVKGVAGMKMPGWARSMMALGKKASPLTSYVVTEENGELFVEV